MKVLFGKLLIAGLLLAGPYISYGVGFASNAIVMKVNNGQMPVAWPGGCNEEEVRRHAREVLTEGMQVHTCMTPETHLKILGDWIVIRDRGVGSIGDFLEWGGEVSSEPCFYMGMMYLLCELFRYKESHP